MGLQNFYGENSTDIGAVQKEIDGILSPNNIWPTVFCSLGNKILVADYQL
jgi:hypothetical protein